MVRPKLFGKVSEEEFQQQLEDVKRDIELEDQGKKKPPRSFQRWFFIILSTVFLLMFLFYAVIGPVEHKVLGRINSENLVDNTLTLKQLTIVFTDETASFLNNLFIDNQITNMVETSACLQGTVENNTYTITSVFLPEIYEQSRRHVTFESCPKDTLILFHTHPKTNCLASQTDINT
ncbi:MAG: hypothetical protein ACQESC_04605, partial [Nanobdellota archaeon]